MKLSVSLLLSCYALLLPALICASPLELRVVDSEGRPLKNAVISSTADSQASAAAKVAVMDQRNRTFVPHVLVVQQGSQVSFPNSDNIRHHVYSFSTPKKFEIKLYSGEPSSPVQFDKPGVVVLGCNIHDSMLGYIYVADGPSYAVSDEQGRLLLEFDQIPADDTQFQLWHPQLNRHNQPVKLSYAEIKQANYRVQLDLAVPAANERAADTDESPLEKRFRELRQRRAQP